MKLFVKHRVEGTSIHIYCGGGAKRRVREKVEFQEKSSRTELLPAIAELCSFMSWNNTCNYDDEARINSVFDCDPNLTFNESVLLGWW